MTFPDGFLAGSPQRAALLSIRDRNGNTVTLLRDSNTRHRDETAVLMTDPFLAEIAMYTSQLDDLQRSIFLNHVRELAAGRRRTA